MSSKGGGKMLYIFGMGLAKEIAFARILCIPEETFIIHLL
jgi:hypothetical protein